MEGAAVVAALAVLRLPLDSKPGPPRGPLAPAPALRRLLLPRQRRRLLRVAVAAAPAAPLESAPEMASRWRLERGSCRDEGREGRR